MVEKEIGMEKLIELLNEREKIVNGVQYPGWCKEHLEYQCHGPRVINKRFGFIKWLVDNDKIKPLRKFIGWETDEDEPYIQFDLVDQYIAYLSIQDEPINFLISILK